MRKYRITESKLRNMIQEAVKNCLREELDLALDYEDGNNGYGRLISDSAANIKTVVDKAIRELESGELSDSNHWFCKQLYQYAKDYIEDYESMFDN